MSGKLWLAYLMEINRGIILIKAGTSPINLTLDPSALHLGQFIANIILVVALRKINMKSDVILCHSLSIKLQHLVAKITLGWQKISS